MATVIDTMQALREHARCTDFVLVGDGKLLSAANRQALLRADLGSLAPLARTPELDVAFLAIPADHLVPLAYVSERERTLPPDERASYHGSDTQIEVRLPAQPGRDDPPRVVPVRRLFVVSHRRIVGLPPILGIALLVFSLLERAARQALDGGQKVPKLLAGQVAARPTGDNLLKALREIALLTRDRGGLRQRWVADLTPLPRPLLRLLGAPEAPCARLAT